MTEAEASRMAEELTVASAAYALLKLTAASTHAERVLKVALEDAWGRMDRARWAVHKALVAKP